MATKKRTPEVETVRFMNTKYPNMQIEVYPEIPAIYDSAGRLKERAKPGKFLKFVDYQLLVEDPDDIDFIRNHPHYTGENDAIKCIIEGPRPNKTRDKILELTNAYGEDKVLAVLEQLSKKAKAKKAAKAQSVEDVSDDSDLEEE